MISPWSRAGHWLAASGIQNPDGGVARYYRADLGKNLAASTEITGYAVSAFALLHTRSGDRKYLECAVRGARFLMSAWDDALQAMPFELEPLRFSYFFDCGIIARGLLSVWRATGDYAYLAAAKAVGDAMLRDFPVNDDGFAPILTLPSKAPLPFEPLRWSRAPGCYQLKSALAWLELADATYEASYRAAYDAALERAMANAPRFLPGHSDRQAVMDRLHPYLYFLEGLTPRANDPRCAAALREGIPRVLQYMDAIGQEFLRADVLAQFLRIRLYAHASGVVPLDEAAGSREASELETFAAQSDDSRLDGGFYFGRRSAEFVPHVSPVPTVFALQALDMWQRRGSSGGAIAVI